MKGRFTKADRIARRAEITRVFRKGRSVSDDRLRVLVLGNSLGRRRLAVAVSARHGGAVRRNRLKRLCRAAYRSCRDELPDGLDYLLQPRAGLEHSYDGLCRSLRSLAGRLAGKEEP